MQNPNLRQERDRQDQRRKDNRGQNLTDEERQRGGENSAEGQDRGTQGQTDGKRDDEEE